MRALFLALLLAVPASAQSLYPPGWKGVGYGKWGGLNLLSDSTQIDGDAQVAVNVLTDNGYLEKRPGNIILATILPGYPVQYVNNWYAPNGSQYLVAQANRELYVTNFSGSPVAISTVADGYNVTTVPAFSKLEVTDGFKPLWYYNGNSTGTVVDPLSGQVGPTCTYIAFKDSRIWCSLSVQGFSRAGNTTNGGGFSTVIISSVGGDGYWSVPYNVNILDNAPNRFDFNPDDGDQITCLANTPWGMFVGKRNSSYIVNGSGNLSYNPRILDPKIGCVDNRTVQMVYGVLVFLSVDGVYGYDGSGPPRILTRELDTLIKQVRESSFSQGAWLTQLQPDWASGSESAATGGIPGLVWDYNTIPGTIFPSSGTLYDDNTSPILQTCTSNLNPATSLPWNCGVGFSSDTLVNIDTTSLPLSGGMAQVIPSTSGVVVWTSSFPAGNYSTIPTSWTVIASNVSAGIYGTTDGNGMNNSNIVSGYDYGLGSPIINASSLQIYTMAPSQGSTPGDNGWNFGHWSASYAPASFGPTAAASFVYGQCYYAAGTKCFEYDFIANMLPTITSWSGYGYDITQGVCTGGICSYVVSLYKMVVGVRTDLGSATIGQPTGAAPVYIPISVTRTPGGAFTVFYGTSTIFSAYDDTSISRQANLSYIYMYGTTVLPGPFPDNTEIISVGSLSTTTLQGFGPGQIISLPFDTGSIAPLAGVMSINDTLSADGATSIAFYVRDSTSPHNDMWSSWQASSNSILAVLPKRHWQYEALFNTSVASETAQLSSIQLSAVTTGYYYSNVNYVGQLITNWRQFGVFENNPGVYNYAVRSASYAFAANAALPSWNNQAANQNISIATGAYAQFRLDSTSLVTNPQGASASEGIISVALSWDQGQNIPATSATLDRRYIICVALSTTTLTPDTCLLRQKTGKWVQWSISTTVGAMGIYNYQMLAADGGTSSKVWEIMQPNVFSDDAQPISASWVGEDFVDGLPFNPKIYYGAWIDATPVLGSSVTYSYQVDKSSGYVSVPFSLDSGQAHDPTLPVSIDQYGDINKWMPPSIGYQVGKYIRAQFSDATLNSYFRINSYQILIQDQPMQFP